MTSQGQLILNDTTLSVQEKCNQAGKLAARMTRRQYIEAKGEDIICYDIARMNAKDQGIDCCINVDIIDIPDNPGLALLQMFDDIRAEKGLPRLHKELYAPRLVYN